MLEAISSEILWGVPVSKLILTMSIASISICGILIPVWGTRRKVLFKCLHQLIFRIIQICLGIMMNLMEMDKLLLYQTSLNTYQNSFKPIPTKATNRKTTLKKEVKFTQNTHNVVIF